MPEDAVIGFRFFATRGADGEEEVLAASARAVEKASDNLLNRTAHDAAFDRLDKAIAAIHAAKGDARGRDAGFDDDDFAGFDFLL